MNKKLLKIGALALGLFASVALLNGRTNAQAINGQVSLTINTGVSQCLYATSLNLGAQNVKFDSAYTFSGSFTGSFSCADYIGVTGGWTFYISAGDLSNGLGNTIASGNVSINHAAGVVVGDASCKAGTATGTTRAPIANNYTIIERTAGTDKVCSVTIDTVSLKVDVAANQAPGSYAGTLTLTIPASLK